MKKNLALVLALMDLLVLGLGAALAPLSAQSTSDGTPARQDKRAYFLYRRQRDGPPPAGAPLLGSLVRARARQQVLPTVGGPWQSRGPAPINLPAASPYPRASGRVLALAWAPADEVENFEKLYLGSADGGVWRSDDGAASWTPKSDGMSSLAVGALAIHATNPRVIFAGTGEIANCVDCLYGVGIYKSLDAGHSWALLGNDVFQGAAVSAIRVNPEGHNTNHVFAATVDNTTTPGLCTVPLSCQGVAISLDLGASWRYPAPGPASLTGLPVTDLAIDKPPIDTGNRHVNLYAAVSNLNGCTPDPRCGIWYSSNEGQTWVQASTGLPAMGGKIYKLALAPTSASNPPGHQILYTVIGDAATEAVLGVYRTDNGGAEGTNPPGVTTWRAVGNLNDMGTQAWYDIYVGVDPRGANTAYVGLTDIYKTSNGGGAWSNLTNFYGDAPAAIHPDQHAVLFFDRGDAGVTIYFGNDGGVYQSADGGMTFSDANGSVADGYLALTQFYGGSLPPPAVPGQLELLMGGSQDNGTLQMQAPDDRSWNQTLGGDGFYTAVDRTVPNNLYAEQPFGDTYSSSDGGVTWAEATTGMPAPDPTGNIDGALFAAPLVIDRVNARTLYSGHARLWRTIDGMTSWAPIGPVTSGISDIAIAPNDPNRVYVADNSGQLWVTANARAPGPAWTPLGYPCPMPAVNCLAAGSYVTGLAVDPTIPQIVYATVNGFQGGQHQHLFRSADAGAHWADRSAGLPDLPFQSVAVNPDTVTTVYVGSNLGVYVSPDSGGTWRVLGTSLPNAAVYQLVPNATGSQLTAFTHGRGAWRAPDAACPVGADKPADITCGTWGATGTLATGRLRHSATLLADGTVLAAAGCCSGDASRLRTAERYDPTTGAWSATGTLATGRHTHTATLLPDGTILVAGGLGDGGPLAAAERYDPATGAWSPAGSMSRARYEHTATLLADGTVLVVGGLGGLPEVPLATAERYDPATGTWSPASSLAVARSAHTATRLADGTVLVAGGYNSDFDSISSAELYDSATDTWSPAESMAIRRGYHTATLLADGSVLAVGGFNGAHTLAETEQYDPATRSWRSTASLVTGRQGHTATLLAQGTVLVAGGCLNCISDALATAEFYDPATNAWSLTGDMATARELHTATLLADGTVLVSGGDSGHSPVLATAERYRPSVVPPGSDL